uniref:Myosin motor domain-containing protein n=1 Tax=Steinernema glaseri TaxID=37863 RepID=A0A1I8AM07_9BILA
MKLVLCLLLALVSVLVVSLPSAKPQGGALFIERYPSDEYHPLDRRFANLLEASFQERAVPLKRNNAEVVNGILKHFGTLGRLGDVGK